MSIEELHADLCDSRNGLRLQKIKTEPDWLPDPSIDFSAPCLVTLMFIDSGKDLNRQERIYVDTRTGTIESTVATAEERVFSVALDEAFSIEVEKIYVTVERGSNVNETYRWKRTIPAHYQLNVEIKCLDHSDAKQFLGLMEMKSASKYRGSLTEEDATLRATWYDLPECPPRGKLLAMTRTDGPRRSINMKFGIEMSMGWSRKKDSPLTIHAKKRRAALVPDQVQLPTPSASDCSGDVAKHYAVTYIFMNKRVHKMENLQCPLCATAPSARAQQKFTSFDRLHAHMLLWHDHFHPRVEMTSQHHTPGTSSFEYTVHLTLSNAPTERIVQPKWSGDEDCWIAPERPFDEKAYLRGEDTWTGHAKRVERPQLNAAKKQPSSGAVPSRAARPALSGIKDLPDTQKERWKIPKVPRVRFYRTKSKRPFEADEEVSESDESVDESWLQAHKRDDMSSLPISSGGKDFYSDWNLAAAEDDSPADLFIRECLIRFARKFRGKMWNDEYHAEFKKMVDRLHALKLIDGEVHGYCSDRRSLLNSDAPAQTAGGKRLRGADDTAHRSLKKMTSDDGPGGQGGKTCSCGSLVASARAAVTCHNIVSLSHS